jgi:hypothetical protein
MGDKNRQKTVLLKIKPGMRIFIGTGVSELHPTCIDKKASRFYDPSPINNASWQVL